MRFLATLCLSLDLCGGGNAATSAAGSAAAAPARLTSCDVSWSTLGRDSQDSMPLGNGDIGLNVWTESNGGHGELGLQKMLIQCDGRKIFLLPAWPTDWTADFKFFAPFNTTATRPFFA